MLEKAMMLLAKLERAGEAGAGEELLQPRGSEEPLQP